MKYYPTPIFTLAITLRSRLFLTGGLPLLGQFGYAGLPFSYTFQKQPVLQGFAGQSICQFILLPGDPDKGYRMKLLDQFQDLVIEEL